jgi:hypothetical protein
VKIGWLRKEAAGKARAGTDFKAVPIMKDEAQRSIRPLYEAVNHGSS